MECSCKVNCDVDDYSTMLSDKIVKARKFHKCGECCRAIEPGEKYRREVTLYDGRIDSCVTCLDCNSIRNQFFISFYWGQILEMFDEFVREVDGEIPEKCISGLTPAARDYVCCRIEDLWNDLYGDEEDDI